MTLRERASTQVKLAQAEALWRAGRALLYEALHAAWDVCVGGETLTLRQKADLLLAMTQAVSGAATAVEWMWSVAGTSGNLSGQPLRAVFSGYAGLENDLPSIRSNGTRPSGASTSGSRRSLPR